MASSAFCSIQVISELIFTSLEKLMSFIGSTNSSFKPSRNYICFGYMGVYDIEKEPFQEMYLFLVDMNTQFSDNFHSATGQPWTLFENHLTIYTKMSFCVLYST